MEYRENDFIVLARDVSDTKRNSMIVLFSTTLLLFWWLGDLVFPIYMDREIIDHNSIFMTISILPILINMMLWLVWGIKGQLNDLYGHRQSHRRDQYELYEFSRAQLFHYKKIERSVYILSAFQFIVMGFMLIFGFLLMRMV